MTTYNVMAFLSVSMIGNRGKPGNRIVNEFGFDKLVLDVNFSK